MKFLYPFKSKLHVTYALLLLLSIIGIEGKSQDNHFTQFYNSPLTLNPALTGLMGNGDMRFTAQYRSQWGSVTVPYETFAGSADFVLAKNFSGDDFVGIGLMLLNDKAGDAAFRTTQAQLSVAYNKSFNGGNNFDHFVSLGAQIGGGQQAVDVEKLLFDSQYDGDVLNTTLGSGENIDRSSLFFIDVSAGLSWYYSPDEDFMIYAGAGMFHLNEPNVGLTNSFQEKLHRKTTAFLGAEFRLNAALSLVPSAIFLHQGKSKEFNGGMLAKFHLNNGSSTKNKIAFSIGTMHRLLDAQIIVTRLDYGPISATISYDINISTLNGASNSKGGLEIGLTYKANLSGGLMNTGRSISCPTF